MDTKKPFFASLLENEKNLEVKTGVQAGRPPYVTLKYPSDDDEGGTDI